MHNQQFEPNPYSENIDQAIFTLRARVTVRIAKTPKNYDKTTKTLKLSQAKNDES